jgi:hypothetical protein
MTPPTLRTYVNFIGAERYMGAGESPDDTVTCGRGILEQVAERLRGAGIASGEVIDEDWGALLEVTKAKERLHVCSGFRGEDWLISVCAPRAPAHAPAATAFLRELLTAIDAALKGLPGILRVTAGGGQAPRDDQPEHEGRPSRAARPGPRAGRDRRVVHQGGSTSLGERFSDPQTRRLRPLGWAVVLLLLAAGGGVYFWLTSQLEALGYDV